MAVVAEGWSVRHWRGVCVCVVLELRAAGFSSCGQRLILIHCYCISGASRHSAEPCVAFATCTTTRRRWLSARTTRHSKTMPFLRYHNVIQRIKRFTKMRYTKLLLVLLLLHFLYQVWTLWDHSCLSYAPTISVKNPNCNLDLWPLTFDLSTLKPCHF